MASAGPNAPGTAANNTAVGTKAWTNPNNATSSDNVRTYCSMSAAGGVGHSNYLDLTGFGFTIPAGATINGVTVAIERYADSATSLSYMSVEDEVVSLVKGGTVSGDNKAATTTMWPNGSGAEAAVSYGGVSDLWGNTFTADDINSSTFGIVLQIKLVNNSGKGKRVLYAYVDFISITITYTEGGGGASAVPVIMNQYRQRRA